MTLPAAMISLLLPFLLAAPAAEPANRFACTAGRKRVEIIQSGDRLIYRYGPPGRPEITLTGGPDGGVFYHVQLYNRGEDQTLRFTSGTWDYVVFNRWQAPTELSTGKVDPEYNVSGLLVMKDGKLVRRIKCTDTTDLREWPIFKRLPVDEDNLTPDDA